MNMIALQKKHLAGIFALVGLCCLATGLVVAQIPDRSGTNVLLKRRETLNSIPKEFGRLAGVERSPDGTVLYFEGDDGTIRFVTVIQGVDYGSLKFRTVTVPRS